VYNDFYLRSEDDPKYFPDTLSVQNELENLTTQVRMTLLTSKNEVLGMDEFGFGALDYLFDTNLINTLTVASVAKEQIDQYCTLAKDHLITTEANVFQLEKYRDGIALDISIDGDLELGLLL